MCGYVGSYWAVNSSSGLYPAQLDHLEDCGVDIRGRVSTERLAEEVGMPVDRIADTLVGPGNAAARQLIRERFGVTNRRAYHILKTIVSSHGASDWHGLRYWERGELEAQLDTYMKDHRHGGTRRGKMPSANNG